MGSQPQLFRIDPSEKQTRPVKEIDFAEAGFKERQDIQEWVVANPGILGEELLVIAKEFSGFDRTDERPDIVAVDTEGNVVVVELKRDDSGANAHWQAIKYASYFQRAREEEIVRMLAEHEQIPDEEATERLIHHLNTGDIEDLNRDQRIILASHRFAPEVTSAVVWLNQNSGKDLITCVQLTPYRDIESGSFYIQASSILPVPGTEEFVVGFGQDRSRVTNRAGKSDEITRFLRGAALEAVGDLPDDLRPEKRSRWAIGSKGDRFYRVWYARPPWNNWGMSYRMRLVPSTSGGSPKVFVYIGCDGKHLVRAGGLSEDTVMNVKKTLKELNLAPNQEPYEIDSGFGLGVWHSGDAFDESFRDSLAATLRSIIERVTPAIEELFNPENEQPD